MNKSYPILCFTLFLSLNFQTQSASQVHSLQSPAWIDRGDNRIPLIPGPVIQASDRIQTGDGGKVILQLSEGSKVKLGEDLEMSIDSIEDNDGSISMPFIGVFNVLKGTFRFTTGLLRKDASRDVKLIARTVTIGLRGTDVWGKVEKGRDFVVLIEGKIDIDRQNTQTIVMDKPLTIFDAPSDQMAKAAEPVDMDKLGQWALETELDQGKGVISADGQYRVNLASYKNKDLANKTLTTFRQQGYAAETYEISLEGISWTPIVIIGFATRSDADYFVQNISQKFGVINAWHNRVK
jgi:hypothetical protein